MSERSQRRRSWWVRQGVVAVAVFAALALAATVLLAQRALDNACQIVIRGDGDTLVSGVIVDLWRTQPELTPGTLAAVVAKHDAEGLRYLALIDRQDHHVIVEAGASEVLEPQYLLGEVVRRGRRVRLVSLIPPLSATGASLDAEASPTGPAQLRPFPRPFLVAEFEPPLIERLRGDLSRISLVGVVAALVLVAFAVALSHTISRLWGAQERAESDHRLAELGRASAVIAHELRNPLAALKGHAQLLVEDLAEPSRTKAARVVDGAERLESLTNVLLEFVRDAPIDVRTVTPADLVDRALAPVTRERVRIDLSGAPKALQVDAERTSLALRNLVQNAIQATPEGANPVEVRIAGGPHGVVIEVRDHGPGVAPGAEAQIFEPFMTTRTRGTGLGLTIARRIAEQHHGRLTGETHRQGGAVFRLVLPLAAETAGHS